MSTPRKVHLTALALIVWFVSASPPGGAADIGAAFTYQGYLEKPAGTPRLGAGHFRLTLLTADGGRRNRECRLSFTKGNSLADCSDFRW